MSDDDLMLDLDAQRKQRAAKREGQKKDQPIVIGGKIIATLPVELPIDILEPLRELDGDITLLLREAMQTAKAGGGAAARASATDLVIDLLASNPALPVNALDIITKIAKNLLTEEGFAGLMEARPSREDYAALVSGIFKFYGLTLGEALPSSDSSTDGQGTGETGGETSRGTSSTTSDSTPEPSGTTTASPASLEPAAS